MSEFQMDWTEILDLSFDWLNFIPLSNSIISNKHLKCNIFEPSSAGLSERLRQWAIVCAFIRMEPNTLDFLLNIWFLAVIPVDLGEF